MCEKVWVSLCRWERECMCVEVSVRACVQEREERTCEGRCVREPVCVGGIVT